MSSLDPTAAIIAAMLLFSCCNRKVDPSGVGQPQPENDQVESLNELPDWLSAYIEQEGEKDGLLEVELYRYNGELVYYMQKACCDRFEEVYSQDGGIICKTGGFTGKGDGKCPDFGMPATSELIRSVWNNR